MLNNKCSRCTETKSDQGKDKPRGMAKKNYALLFFKVEKLKENTEEQLRGREGSLGFLQL